MANQTQNLAAILSNFNTATEATATAYNSTGSAAKENQKVVESLQGELATLNTAFQKLANTVVDSGLISAILKLSTVFLQFLSTPVGSFLTQVTLLSGVLGGLGSKMKYFMPIVTQFKNAIFVLQATMGGAATVTEALNFALGSALFPTLLAGVATAWIIVKAVDELTFSLKEQQDVVNNIQSNINSLNSEYQSLLAKDNLTEAESRRLDLLEQEIALQEKSLAIEAKRQYQMEYTDKTLFSSSGLDQIEAIISSYEKLDLTTAKSLEEQNEIIKKQYDFSLSLIEEAKNLEDLKKSMGNAWDATGRGQKVLDQIYATIGRVSEQTKETNEQIQGTSNSFNSMLSSAQMLSNGLDILAQAQRESADGGKLTYSTVQQLLAAYPDLYSSIIQTADGYYIEESALNTLIETQRISNSDALKSAVTAAQKILEAEGIKTDAYDGTTTSIIKQLYAQKALYEEEKSFVENYSDPFGLINKVPSYKNQKTSSIQGQINDVDALIKTLEELQISSKKVSGLGTGATVATGESATKSLTDSALTIFQNYYKDLQHLRNTDEISEEQYYEELNKLIKEYTASATKNMKAYGTDADTIRRNMYQYEEELATHATEAIKAEEQKKVEAIKSALTARKTVLEERQSAYESLFNYMSTKISAEIQSLEDEKTSISNYYQTQIDALNATNEALEKELELENALKNVATARSKQVMVYKDGRYQYVSDADAVSEAQANLSSIQRQRELAASIQSLENARDRQLAAIDVMLYGDDGSANNPTGGLYAYKKGWESVVEDYRSNQDKLLIEQQLGIKLEGDNWKERLSSLRQYVSEYNSIMSQLDITGSTLESFGSSESIGDTEKSAIIAQMKSNSAAWHGASSSEQKELASANLSLGTSLGWTRDQSGTWYTESGTKAYANGTMSASGGLSLVGENGAELRVLGKQDGIIPADVTKNLWSWGMTTPASMVSAIGSITSGVGQKIQSVTIQNLNLPNVQDGNGFVEYMKNNFWTSTVQFSTT